MAKHNYRRSNKTMINAVTKFYKLPIETQISIINKYYQQTNTNITTGNTDDFPKFCKSIGKSHEFISDLDNQDMCAGNTYFLYDENKDKFMYDYDILHLVVVNERKYNPKQKTEFSPKFKKYLITKFID